MPEKPHAGVPCPLCSTQVFLKFPADYPTEEVIATRYTHAVMAAVGGVKKQACRALGITFRTLNRRLVRELKPAKRVVTADDRARAFEAAAKAKSLVPIGPAGVCAGSWAMSGKGVEAVFYDVWFNDGVSGVLPSTVAAAGEKPKIVLGESDGSVRTFEFGEVCPTEAIVCTAPAGPKHAIVGVVNTMVEES